MSALRKTKTSSAPRSGCRLWLRWPEWVVPASHKFVLLLAFCRYLLLAVFPCFRKVSLVTGFGYSLYKRICTCGS